MYREDLMEATIATIRGYYAALPETIAKVAHVPFEEVTPSMEELMDSKGAITDAMALLDHLVNARGSMPSDYTLMATLYLARSIQIQEHLDECEDCQEGLLETIRRNDQLGAIRAQLREILSEEDGE